MKKPQNCRIDGLSTWELEALLQDELARDKKDYVLIHQLLERLKAKSTALPEVTQEEVEAAMLTLQESKIVPKEKKRPALWRKPLLAVAAVFCVVLLAVPMASGTPFVQELIAKWNDKFFWIESPGTPVAPPEDYVFQTDNPGLQQLYDAVTEQGITAPVVPMWLPDGFEIISMEKITGKNNTKILYYFAVDNSKFVFYIEEREKDTKQVKVDERPEIWEYEGIKHFYISNYSGSKVVWNIGNYDMMIISTLDKDVVESIVRSVYYGRE